MVKAVQANVTPAQRWVVLYVKRWLTAPLALPDGTLQARDRGTPQGSAVSPVLANLFLHYAFDSWLAREFPAVEFERYADDAVVHCVTARPADDRGGPGPAPGENQDRVCATRAEGEVGPIGRRPRSMCCCVGDEGLMALRRRPSGGGVKPPHAALAEDRRGER
jgi:Reverse transcriptase (RNA-dependent DNA polymerase)